MRYLKTKFLSVFFICFVLFLESEGQSGEGKRERQGANLKQAPIGFIKLRKKFKICL